jgi:hypothetical protein
MHNDLTPPATNWLAQFAPADASTAQNPWLAEGADIADPRPPMTQAKRRMSSRISAG